MSENKYTPEPWRTDAECGFPQDIHDSKGNLFLRCSSDFDNEIYGEANARRIVACVNACAGCATEVLETAPVGFFNSTYGHPKYLEEITKQRDELLAALDRLAFAAECRDNTTGDQCRLIEVRAELAAAAANARAVIAAATGTNITATIKCAANCGADVPVMAKDEGEDHLCHHCGRDAE